MIIITKANQTWMEKIPTLVTYTRMYQNCLYRDALLKTNREIAPRIVETIHNNIQGTSKDWHDNQHIKKLDKIDINYYIKYRSIEGT